MWCGLVEPVHLATTSPMPSVSDTARMGPPAMMPVPAGRRAGWRARPPRHYNAVVAPGAEVPIHPVAAGAGLVDEAQRPAAPAEPDRQLVQRRRRA
jgi:hypothetical protein